LNGLKSEKDKASVAPGYVFAVKHSCSRVLSPHVERISTVRWAAYRLHEEADWAAFGTVLLASSNSGAGLLFGT